MDPSTLKHPSAWIPPIMSLTALAVVLVHMAWFGIAREADEGAAAHIFQLLIAGQMPVIVFFALKWLPKHPARALAVMALQFAAVIAACAPVFLLHL
jgi:hypothetical protein